MLEKKEKIKLYLERIYPYFIAILVVGVAVKNRINFIGSANLDNVLDACNTVVALIIGFLGAILPVILGMKNESKIVKYVFEKDKNKLFLKYIKATILWGLIALAVAMSMYLVGDFKNTNIAYWEFYVWLFLIVLFLLLTYRSLSSMLDLIFLSDDVLEKRKNRKNANERKEIADIEERFEER